jgi:hypothetical protein
MKRIKIMIVNDQCELLDSFWVSTWNDDASVIGREDIEGIGSPASDSALIDRIKRELAIAQMNS